jgi:DNA mismatch endonuclease (patch repair protein)
MDRVTPEQRSLMMRAIRSKDMSPELAVRRLVHRMGYRYRLHDHSLPGRADIVFPGRRKIIFVHGCFWHQHQNGRCRLVHKPLSNLVYWQPKLERNKTRDAAHCEALKAAGWDVLIVWECEVEEDTLADRLAGFLGPRGEEIRRRT